MKVNIFAGSRRIALLLGIAWTIGCIAYAALSDRYVSLSYSVSQFGAPPAPVDDCQPRDAQKYTTYTTPSGEDVRIELCFVLSKAEDGSYLVPYRLVVSPENPVAKRVYAARAEALRQGASADAAKLTEFLLKMPVDESGPAVVWMAGEYDSDVRRYMDEVAAAFRLGSADFERLDRLKQEKLWERWTNVLMVLFGGLAVGWAFTASIGWIARGFMGISRGKDMRDEP